MRQRTTDVSACECEGALRARKWFRVRVWFVWVKCCLTLCGDDDAVVGSCIWCLHHKPFVLCVCVGVLVYLFARDLLCVLWRADNCVGE